MALNTREMYFNGIKIAVFSKKLIKNRPTAGGFAPKPPSVLRLRYTTFLNTSPKLDICTFQRLLKALPLQNPAWMPIGNDFRYSIQWYLCPTKVPLLKIFDDVIACGLWFGLPYQSKILATPINWRLPEKNFEDLFFWRTLAAVSLVLGLEHSCPWPREGLSSKRLSLALASDFFCVLCLQPCVLDSTTVR